MNYMPNERSHRSAKVIYEIYPYQRIQAVAKARVKK
jgi:hypothetical protein